MAILELHKLTKNFAGLTAVNQVDLQINAGDALGLIGPNGAGKTTMFNMITNIIPASSGRVIWKGEDITGKRPDVIARKGIVRTFQATRLFRQLTVLESVMIGRHLRAEGGVLDAIFATPAHRAAEKESRKRAREILEFVGLSRLDDVRASGLAYGDTRILGIACALAAEPELLLLDEPAAGLNPEETMSLLNLVQNIRDSGITICLVEHDMKFLMSLASRVVVLDAGRKIAEGTPLEVRNNKRVIEVYLGGGKFAEA